MALTLSNTHTNNQNDIPEDIPKGLDTNTSLGWKMLCIAVFLGCISLWMNVSFGYSLGTDYTSKLAMAGEYISFDLAKLIALTIIGFAWAKRNYAIAVVFTVVFVLTVGFSLISAQSYMAKLMHSQKVERVMQSDAYQDNQNAKNRAQAKVEDLAVSSSEVNEAQTKVERLERQRSAAETAYENYAAKSNYPTATGRALSELNRVESELEKHQSIVDQGSAYNGALANLDRLENKKFTGSVLAGESGEDAGFSSVAFAFGVDVKTFIARLLLFMAVGSEIITTMFFFYAGHVMGLRVRKYSHEEMIQMQLQLAKEEQEKSAMGLHVNNVMAISENSLQVPETVADTKTSEQPKIDPENIKQVKPLTKEKKAVGTEYECSEDECNNTFIARTVWHKYCAECRCSKDSSKRRVVKK